MSDADAVAAKDAFQQDNLCYTIEDVEGNSVTDPEGILYLTANSASGSKFYELIAQQQDYIAARSQNWLAELLGNYPHKGYVLSKCLPDHR